MEYRFSNKVSGLKPSAIREIFKSLTDPSIIAFAAGNPAAESFPTEDIKKIADKIFSDSSLATEALQYSVTEGKTHFRDQVAARLKDKFSIGRENDETIITTGGQQGLDLACKVLCNEGDVVICENPSFIGALNAYRSYGTRLVGVDLEEDGISLEGLENVLKKEKNAKLLYIIPTFQNPTGKTTSLEKRKAVYRLCSKYGVVILEDNPYGELRFAGEDVPPIKSFDEEGIVIYSGSFSKILSAGMRIGFVCAPQEIVQKMVVCKQTNDVHSNIFFQMVCSQYIDNYDLDAHIAEVRKLYGRKCGLMIDAMEMYFDDSITFTRPEGGIFVWAAMPEGYDSAALAREALKRKVAIVPGSTFNPDSNKPSNGFRLNYSTPTDAQITEGIKILSEVMRDFMK